MTSPSPPEPGPHREGRAAHPARWAAPRGRRVRRRTASRTLGSYAAEHLARKRAAREAGERWLTCVKRHLEEAAAFLGPHTPLHAIGNPAVEAYLGHLLAGGPEGKHPRSDSTVNHYLDSLSNLFRRAVADGLLERNPVKQLLRRPDRGGRAPLVWLEAGEVADVLAFARRYRPKRPDLAVPFLFELLSTFAYTGLRKSEGLGLEVRDVKLERGIILVRPNRWRRLKNRVSEREVPLFTELAVSLTSHLESRRSSREGALLFPSPAGDEERPLQNLRRTLDQCPMPARLAEAAADDSAAPPGVPPLRLGILRHSYCAARLQTLDWGKPIAPFTVAREMGHRDLRMVLRIYGHLGRVRARGAQVSFLGPIGPAPEGSGRIDPPAQGGRKTHEG